MSASGFLNNVAHLPVISVIVDGCSAKALVDTGCSRSIVSRRVVRHSKLSSVNEPVVMMNGDVSVCTESCWVSVSVEGNVLLLNCLISEVVPGFQMLL